MSFIHCSKSAHAIGRNRSRVFWLPGNIQLTYIQLYLNTENHQFYKIHKKYLQN